MARTDNLTNFLNDVATAIKNKKHSVRKIYASDFDTEIASIPSQGILQEKSVEITENGVQTILPDENYNGMSSVEVTTDVPFPVKLFETEQEMNADPDIRVDSMAIVYKEEMQNITVDTEFSEAMFPAEVEVPEEITNDIDLHFRSVDHEIYVSRIRNYYLFWNAFQCTDKFEFNNNYIFIRRWY